MKKSTKGHYGYIRARKKSLIMRTLILTIGVIGLFLIGYSMTKTRNNLLTVAAILTVIPAANQAVILFAILPFKGRTKEEYDSVKEIVNNGILDTELVITSKTDKTVQLDYVYVHSTGVYCYSFLPNIDRKRVEEYLTIMLKNNELKTKVKLFQEWKMFVNRLKELEPVDRDTCEENLLKIEGVLRALSI